MLAREMAELLADEANVTDQALVVRCQQGDRLSFRELYRRYQQRVRSTVYQLCGANLLDDLVQEVFLKAWQGLPKLRQPDYFATWLYRITWNVAKDQRRHWAKHSWEQTNSEAKSDLIHNSVSTPENAALMDIHYRELVQQGLQSLSLEHRAVLILHDLEDLPQQEVAEILKIPIGTVKSRLFHARSGMRKFLQQQGELL
jgi:RNA polymerase sigma-70 factor (ECF subfamily)